MVRKTNRLAQWQLWFHYALLTGLVVGFFHLNGQHWLHESFMRIVVLYLVIAIGDQIIHWILQVTTGWED